MLNRLVAADCNLELMWGLDQDRGARNSGRAGRRVLKGKGRREGGVHPGTSGTSGDWGLQTKSLRQGRKAVTHRWQTQMGTEGHRHCTQTIGCKQTQRSWKEHTER